jgi:hypothetical protein
MVDVMRVWMPCGWVYKPTLLAGQPVDAVSTITLKFALQSEI